MGVRKAAFLGNLKFTFFSNYRLNMNQKMQNHHVF